MDHPDDKRSKIYRIKEVFFDLWLSMNESRKQRKRLPALTEFFELWYQREEREQKRRALVDQLLADKSAPAAADHRVATLEYLADIGTDDEKIAAKTWVAAALQESGRPQQVAAYLDEVKTLKPRGVMQWLTRHGELWTDNARWPDPIKQVEEMIACWELQRAGHLEEFTSRLLEIGRSLQGRGLHQALADLLLSSARELADSEGKIEIMLQAALSQLTTGDLSSALNTLQAALQIAVDTGNHRLEGTTLNNLSQVYDARGDYDRALEYLEQALTICREVGNRSGEGTTLNNLSQIHRARGARPSAGVYWTSPGDPSRDRQSAGHVRYAVQHRSHSTDETGHRSGHVLLAHGVSDRQGDRAGPRAQCLGGSRERNGARGRLGVLGVVVRQSHSTWEGRGF